MFLAPRSRFEASDDLFRQRLGRGAAVQQVQRHPKLNAVGNRYGRLQVSMKIGLENRHLGSALTPRRDPALNHCCLRVEHHNHRRSDSREFVHAERRHPESELLFSHRMRINDDVRLRPVIFDEPDKLIVDGVYVFGPDHPRGFAPHIASRRSSGDS